MPIFISYTHGDRQFVDRLAAQLVAQKVSVWIDRWELSVGDSMISKVQDAIAGASALLVILSKASVTSSWVQKEINSGLLRELEEQKVIVLPVLIEDCKIPLFLQDKLYADFRSDFDVGLRMTLEAVARISNPSTGRVEDPSFDMDWALDWGMDGAFRHHRLTVVEQAQGQPYTVLCTVEAVADESATNFHDEMDEAGRTAEAQRLLVQLIVSKLNAPADLVFLLCDQFEQARDYFMAGDFGFYHVRVSARRLGADTGRDVLFRAGEQLRQIFEQISAIAATDGGDS